MKRYLLFMGDTYYPMGGWQDLRGSFDTVEEALVEAVEAYGDWYQIVDAVEGKIVKEN